ncbi:hypothetical protein JNM05_04710 [bacterium]|nr:hypothetical protein [bacterium]
MFSRSLLTVVFISLMAIQSADAKIWTVSPRPGANFTTLSGAVGSASVLAGDTILVSGAPASYAGFTISKKLTIIGPGYFLGENTGLQADTNSAKISSQVTINAQGTVIMGIHFLHSLYINADNVSITRCRMYTTTAGTYPVYMYARDSIIIRQCFITQAANYYYHCIAVQSGASQIFIQNNFIEYLGGNASYGSLDINGTISGDISNNVIYGDVDNVSGGFTFNNNILRGGTFSTTGVIPYNNIGDGTQFGTSNGNQQNVNMNSVFVGTGSSDAKWQVAAAGPADNTGFGGVDCGMFETSLGYQYILSGIPAVPSIYLFNTNVNGNNLDVNVNVKSNN